MSSPVILAIDPASDVVGLARLDTLTGTALLDAVNYLPDDPMRTWDERLGPAIERLSQSVTHVVIEKPPPAVRGASATERGTATYAMGLVTGEVRAWCREHLRIAAEAVEVGDWQATRRFEVMRGRVVVPSVGLPGGPDCRIQSRKPIGASKWRSRWACGAEKDTSKVLDSTACPSCTKPQPDPREIRRQQHKAESYAVAMHLWPVEVARIEQEARRLARSKKDAPGWEQRRVPDACEAGLVALHKARLLGARW